MEHFGPVQVHNPGGQPPGLGLLRPLLAQQAEPDHRLRLLGQERQGVEPDQLRTLIENTRLFNRVLREHEQAENELIDQSFDLR